MKFRTETEIKPFGRKIGYSNRLFAIGSCFADNMAAALRHAKFRITANPSGVLFNPCSIADALRMFASKTVVKAEDIAGSGGRFFDYRFHGSFAAATAGEVVRKANDAVAAGHEALEECDTVIITFGTAWVYILDSTSKVVANCHKQPSALFTRRRLTVEEIVSEFSELAETILKGRQVIVTVSPVRHLGDGLDGNFLSKATLRVAAAELAGRYENILYFPAYEIMNDDLRDYRFYAEDMVHPSPQAVAYIREKFFEAALTEQAKLLLPRAERITAAAAHRPSDPRSDAFREFCRRMLADIEEVNREAAGIDFSAERDYFNAFLQ